MSSAPERSRSLLLISSMIPKSSGVLLSGALLLALAWWIRSPSFQQSVIDHDESTYIVIGEALWKGKLLYTDVWDTKPAGIFLIFGAVLKLFGGSIFTIRTLTTLMVALTGWMLCLAKRRWGHTWSESLISGMLSILMCSAQSFGLPGHIELFFIPWIAIALWLLSGQDPPSLRKIGLASFTLGLGFIVKYVTLFDALAFSLIFLGIPIVRDWKVHKAFSLRWFKPHISKIVTWGVMLALPFMLLHIYFAFAGHFQDFYEATYIIPRRYVNTGNSSARWKLIIEFHRVYQYIAIAFYLSMILCLVRWFKSRDKGYELLLAFIWWVLVWCSVLTPGKSFTHYLLQLALPTSFFAPRLVSLVPIKAVRRGTFGLIFVSLLIYTNSRVQDYHRIYHKRPDIPREAAAYLRPKLKPQDQIFTANFDHILYHLLERQSPTKYVHRSLLTNPQHLKTLALDPHQELTLILNQQPRFILTVGTYGHHLLYQTLQRKYRRVKLWRQRYSIYERID